MSLVSVALAGVMSGSVLLSGAPLAQANRTAVVSQQSVTTQRAAGADELCTVIGIGSGAAGLSKALAKGASWVGIGASIGCYAYTQAKKATPAQQRAAMMKSYEDYQRKSDLGKLDALGYYCRKKGGGGGGGTDGVSVGWRDITMKGVTYSCTATRD